jgi:Na+/proline symporter
MAVIAGALAIYGPIVTPPGYFDFIDDQVIFGIPNFGYVISNAPFLPVGVIGVLWKRRDAQAKVVRCLNRSALWLLRKRRRRRLWVRVFSPGAGRLNNSPRPRADRHRCRVLIRRLL